jgi:hypothetical protein
LVAKGFSDRRFRRGVEDNEHYQNVRAGRHGGRYRDRDDAGSDHRRVRAVPAEMRAKITAIAAMPVLSTSALA